MTLPSFLAAAADTVANMEPERPYLDPVFVALLTSNARDSERAARKWRKAAAASEASAVVFEDSWFADLAASERRRARFHGRCAAYWRQWARNGVEPSRPAPCFSQP